MQAQEQAPSGADGRAAASAVTIAGAVRQKLESVVEDRRRQSLAVAQMAGVMKGRIQELSEELGRAQEENRSLREELARLGREYDALVANQHRLYEGFTSLLRAIDDATSAQVGIDQRLEAVLLSSDIGLSLGAPGDVTSARVGNFIGEAIGAPALQNA